MVIDERKVNLAEADIEQWLWENPEAVYLNQFWRVTEWLYRQLEMPSGIAGLVGVTPDGNLMLVEVKNVRIGPEALTQVQRYAYDLDEIVMAASNQVQRYEIGEVPRIFKVVIGRSIDEKTLTEANAMDVNVLVFEVAFDLSIEMAERPYQSQRKQVDGNRAIGASQTGARLIQYKIERDQEEDYESDVVEHEDKDESALDFDFCI